MKSPAAIFTVILACWFSVAHAANPPAEKIVGMYVHQHWSYNHPYAARTWTLEDWRGYLDGLRRIGYNTVLIWPMLENMPDPLTPSDEASIAKTAAVIDMAHRDFNMRAYIVLCPNVAPKSEEARKYTFEARPFFHTDARVDPGDPAAFGQLMAWREKLLKPLANMDGLFIIDSDPGGFANSTNMEFVYILGAHRRVLDRLRPGIEVNYWAHAGWEAYGRYYATGEFVIGEKEEVRDAISLLSRQHYEPWGVAMRYPDIADPLGLGQHVLAFPYGAIEGEPSFPFTLYGGDHAYDGGKRGGQRGVMGNSQTHAVQLPNAFAFARGAKGLNLAKTDYLAFANDLIPGQGENIVEGWEALQGTDPARMDTAAVRLAASPPTLQGGVLKGLLFGSPARFVDDLVLQLRARAALQRFAEATTAAPADGARIKATLAAFISAIEAWQQKHGYSDSWHWPRMRTALESLESPHVAKVYASLDLATTPGATPFERVANRLAYRSTFSARLIGAMKSALAGLDQPKTPVGQPTSS